MTVGDIMFPGSPSFPEADIFTQDNMAVNYPGHVAFTGSIMEGSPLSDFNRSQSAERRTAESVTDHRSVDEFGEDARTIEEEDKRRRNTAASARFRIKKKQREEALEKAAKQMADKIAAFEKRIKELEMENKWLQKLVME